MTKAEKQMNQTNMQRDKVIDIINLGFSYNTSKVDCRVFKDVNLQIREDEFFCIIGPSGCGKTTLLNNIAGFEKVSEGRLLYRGKEIDGVSHKRTLVFQQDATFPWLTVYKNIEYGLKIRKVPEKERSEKVKELIALVGLRGAENLYPKELSGGMKKRVDLARALVNDPDILLMDEPFASLDAMTKEVLLLELTKLWEKNRMTVIFITHDLEEALFLGDRVAIMQHINTGIPFKIFDVPFQRPRDIYLKENNEFQKMRINLIQEFKLLQSNYRKK